jgi:hypothetical protein
LTTISEEYYVNSAKKISRSAGFSSRSAWSIAISGAAILLLIYLLVRVDSTISSIGYGLTPPQLAPYKELKIQYINPTGWGNKSSQWFHHTSQGTSTLPIPYDWLVALEAPKTNPWLMFFGQSEHAFIGDYLLRLGFIQQTSTEDNPDALPIGIAKTDSIYFPGLHRKTSAAGFTCAACHTGQLVLNDTRYIIDGGPAVTDLGRLWGRRRYPANCFF